MEPEEPPDTVDDEAFHSHTITKKTKKDEEKGEGKTVKMFI